MSKNKYKTGYFYKPETINNSKRYRSTHTKMKTVLSF